MTMQLILILQIHSGPLHLSVEYIFPRYTYFYQEAYGSCPTRLKIEWTEGFVVGIYNLINRSN